jgi:hypothetical protein
MEQVEQRRILVSSVPGLRSIERHKSFDVIQEAIRSGA